MADTTTSVMTETLQNLYGVTARRAFTQGGQFWRAGKTSGSVIREDTGGTAKAVVFDIYSAGTVSTTALSENSDGPATSLADTQVTVTLKEYGDYVHYTRKFDRTSYNRPLDHASWGMGDLSVRTLDTLARDSLDSQTGATWVGYGGGGTSDAVSVATITKGNTLEANDVRKAWAKLRALNVPPLDGGYYWAYVHPHVLKDLQGETGDASWVKSALYNQETLKPIRDEEGIFAGFRFIITANAKLQSKAGNGTTTSAVSADVYTSYFLGQDAMGFATDGDVPKLQIGMPQVSAADVYGRFTTVSWYGLCAFKALRADSLFKVYSASTLAANGA